MVFHVFEEPIHQSGRLDLAALTASDARPLYPGSVGTCRTGKVHGASFAFPTPDLSYQAHHPPAISEQSDTTFTARQHVVLIARFCRALDTAMKARTAVPEGRLYASKHDIMILGTWASVQNNLISPQTNYSLQSSRAFLLCSTVWSLGRPHDTCGCSRNLRLLLLPSIVAAVKYTEFAALKLTSPPANTCRQPHRHIADRRNNLAKSSPSSSTPIVPRQNVYSHG